MLKEDFIKLTKEEREIVIQEQAEYISEVEENLISIRLYLLGNFYIEEFRDITSNFLMFIEPVNELERFDKYLETIDYVYCEVYPENKEFELYECSECGFNLIVQKSETEPEITCPECNNDTLTKTEE